VQPLVDAGLLTADEFVSSGCPWSTAPPNPDSVYISNCYDFRRKLYPLLDRQATDYDAVLTTGRLTVMIGNPETVVNGLSEAWRRVTRQGVPVLVLRDNPQDVVGGHNPQFCLAEVSVSEANAKCALNRHYRLDRWFDALTLAARRTPGARMIDLTPYYCDRKTCPVVVGGVNVYRDDNHISVTYAKTLAPYLWRAILRTGVLPRTLTG
jgi:hypothetical protein